MKDVLITLSIYILVVVQWYVQISTDDDLNSLRSGFDKLHSLECCLNRVKCSILLVLYIYILLVVTSDPLELSNDSRHAAIDRNSHFSSLN